MLRNRYAAEQLVNQLREVGLLSRKDYDGLRVERARRLKEPEPKRTGHQHNASARKFCMKSDGGTGSDATGPERLRRSRVPIPVTAAAVSDSGRAFCRLAAGLQDHLPCSRAAV